VYLTLSAGTVAGGRGRPASIEDALTWFEVASREGHGIALLELAGMYQDGTGDLLALLSLKECLRRRGHRVCALLSVSYCIGWRVHAGVVRDEARAERLRLRAAVQFPPLFLSNVPTCTHACGAYMAPKST
jgi:TPR repeat protein